MKLKSLLTSNYRGLKFILWEGCMSEVARLSFCIQLHSYVSVQTEARIQYNENLKNRWTIKHFLKIYSFGSSAMEQEAVKPAFQMGAKFHPNCSIAAPASWCGPRKQQRLGQVLGMLCPDGRLKRSYWLPALDWYSSGHIANWGEKKQMEDIIPSSHSVNFAFQIKISISFKVCILCTNI